MSMKSPPEWVKDEDVTCCLLCNVEFTLTTRRHHCRKCGKIFCGECSDMRGSLPEYGLFDPVRLCRPCCGVVIPGPSIFTQIVSSHEGPKPVWVYPPDYSLSIIPSPVIILDDKSIIQRGMDKTMIKSHYSDGKCTFVTVPYVTTQKLQKEASEGDLNEYITKSGPFLKMLYSTPNKWTSGQLLLDGINILWNVRSEGHGGFALKLGSTVEIANRGDPKISVLNPLDSFSATGVDGVVQGDYCILLKNPVDNETLKRADTLAVKEICYLSFSTDKERIEWYYSILHNLQAYIHSDQCFEHVRKSFVDRCSRIGVMRADRMDWRSILDQLYTDGLQANKMEA